MGDAFQTRRSEKSILTSHTGKRANRGTPAGAKRFRWREQVHRLRGGSRSKRLRNRVDDWNWTGLRKGKWFARWTPTDVSENQGFQRLVSYLKHCGLPGSGGVLGWATHLDIIMLAAQFLVDWRGPVMRLALEMQVRENDTVDQKKSRSTEKV